MIFSIVKFGLRKLAKRATPAVKAKLKDFVVVELKKFAESTPNKFDDRLVVLLEILTQ